MRKFSQVFVGASILLAFSLGSRVPAQSLDELHKAAVNEGGTLNFYSTLAQVNADKILPVFEKRFPGIKINQVDATGDKLLGRAITEYRGGQTFGDVFQISLGHLSRAYDQGLLADTEMPESAAYPAGLKGPFWTASDIQYYIAAWNTHLVEKDKELKSYDDFLQLRWKGRLMTDPGDIEMLRRLPSTALGATTERLSIGRK